MASQQSREHADADSWIRGLSGEVWFSEIGISSFLLLIFHSRTISLCAYI